MLKKLTALILACCLVFCSAAFAEETTEEDVSSRITVDRTVYEDERITVRLVYFQPGDGAVTVRLAVSASEGYYCSAVSDLTKAMLTEYDFIVSLKMMKDAGSGNSATSVAPGETAGMDFIWSTGEIYDQSLFGQPGVPCSRADVPAEGFPEGTVAGLTLLITDHEISGFEDLASFFFPDDSGAAPAVLDLHIVPAGQE